VNESQIFLDALKLADPAARAAFLDATCAGNPALRVAVEALLKAQDDDPEFLEEPAASLSGTINASGQAPTGAAQGEIAGTVIGPYKLVEQIGEGGMGTVWMAQQTEPVKRLVALKLIKAGMDSKQVVARFEAERQALALMDHPNIARVIDGGTTDAGRPYFVMDLVKGVPITRYCDEHHLTPRQRLELFLPVCQAVQHAHQKGIIHRDLKPSNVLVALYDDKPVPKVIDFGVAKAAGQSLTDKTLVTGFGNIVGTLEYMSPEQAEVNQLDIDTRSDIYSLGVLLYELLTGSPPFTKKELEKAGMLEMLRVIREQKPSKPSTKLSTAEGLPALAANRGTEPARLTRLVRGELDWIVMKALEKDRNRRYETANGFAMDVQRYLADEPVLAGPPSARYRLRKFVSRNKAAATMAAMFALALFITVAALSVSTLLTSRAYAAEKAAHGRAEANFQRARSAVHDFFTTVSQNKLLDVPGVQPVRQELLQSAVHYYQDLARERDDDPTIRADLALAHLRLAEVYYEVGDNNKAVASIDAGLDLADQLVQDHPDDWNLLRRLAGYWKGTRRMRGSDPGPNDLVAAERALSRLIRIWQTLSDKDPSERAIRGDLAATYLRLGQLLDIAQRRPEAAVVADKAARILDSLIREYPKEPEYLSAQIDVVGFLQYLARIAGQNQRQVELSRKAIEVRDQLAAMKPTAPPHREDIANGIMVRAKALRDRNMPAEAEEQYRRALAIWEKLADEYPMNALYRSRILATCGSLAVLLRPSGNPEEAERFRLRFAEALDKAVVDLPAELDANIELADIIRQNALSMEQDAKSRESMLRHALNICERLSVHAPNNVSNQIQLCWVHFSYGLILREQPGRQQEAKRQFRAAIAIGEKVVSDSPGNETYLLWLAYWHRELVPLLSDTGQINEAANAYRRAIDLYEKHVARFPNDREYALVLNQTRGQLHVLLGEWDKAIAQYTQFIEREPDRWESWFDRAMVYQSRKQFEKALPDFSKAIELNRQRDNPWLLGDAFHHRAFIYFMKGELEKALAGYSTAIELAPNNIWHWLGRAKTYAQLKQWPQAVADGTRGLELKADFIDLRQTRGDAYAALGQWDKAAGDYSELLKFTPNDYNVFLLRAVAYVKLKRPELAVADLRQAFSKGYKDLDAVKKDDAFAPLRDRDDFKKLLAEPDAKKK
jgi:serine/threonine protein kinase/tetratricopeptide (TPR) repeat protein